MATNEKHTNETAFASGRETAERGEIITLTDDRGNDIDFEFLDLIEYSSNSYAVLIPTDEAADQVLIFKDNTFSPVEDPDLAQAIFDLFRIKNEEYFDFT